MFKEGYSHMKKTTKSLLVSATVLLALAPAATLASGSTTNTADAAINFNQQGYWVGPSININYTNSIQVKTGSSQASLAQVKAGDVSATSADGEKLGVTAQADPKLYSSLNAAVLEAPASVVSNATATAGKTYYQRVAVQVTGVSVTQIVSSRRLHYTNADVTFNGAQENYSNIANGQNSWIVYRAVTISDNPTNNSSANFYDIPTNGVVKTSDNGLTNLYDPEGNKIGTRALGPTTSWFTDRQRVANDGTVYYRVSTSEYVKENEGITFIPNN